MASLFELLMDTMPIAGVIGAIERRFLKKDPREITESEARSYLRYFPLDADKPPLADIPEAPKSPPAADDVAKQRLWGWTYSLDEPAKVTDIYCRVRDANYGAFKVLDAVEWGLEDPIGNFRNSVRITGTADGATPVELPLKKEFIVARWLAVAGYMPEDQTPLWRLEELHDRSLVVAFAYDLDPTSGEPLVVSAPTEKEQKDAWDMADAAARRLTPIAAQQPLESDPLPLDFNLIPLNSDEGFPVDAPQDDAAPPPPADSSPGPGSLWGTQILSGEFMAGNSAPNTVQGKTGDDCPANVSAARVLVVLTLTCCRERAQFEPGAVVGVARLYPHIMVRASIPLAKIEASTRLDRPAETTPWSGNDVEGMVCCQGHDGSDHDVRTVLIADANSNPAIPAAAPTLPFWSNMFAYYQTDAYALLANQRLRMVRRDRPDARTTDDTFIVRRVVAGLDVYTIEKEAHQGEFDNIHIAPRMKLLGVSKMWGVGEFEYLMTPYHPFVGQLGGSEGFFDADREAMRLDDIVMAPFCSHDCFHMHWRWGSTADAKWALGWNDTGPYSVAGAPLVPLNQDVDIWLRGNSSITYHATVSPPGEQTTIDQDAWSVILHHGAGYACGIADTIKKVYASQFAFDVLAAPPIFMDGNGTKIDCTDSWSMFYWYCRYSVSLSDDGTIFSIIERTAYDAKGVERARQL